MTFSPYIKGQLKISIYISGGVSIFFFIFICVSSNITIADAAIMSFALDIFFLIFMSLQFLMSKWREKSIIRSRGFKQLVKNGFKLIDSETHASISGLIREYNVDLYYAPHETIEFRGRGAYIITVYYTPIKSNTDLNKLQIKHNPGLFNPYHFTFRENYLLMKNKKGLRFPSHSKLFERMNLAVDILIQEGIHPKEKA